MRCKECYYCSVYENALVCNYCLLNDELRGCEVEECDKFLKKPKDYNIKVGCGQCKFFSLTDGFTGHCSEKEIDINSYHPIHKECFVRAKI